MTLRARRWLAVLCSTPLWVLLVLAVVLRLAAGAAISARGVDPYEFGTIARNLAAGRGYSYFAALPSGVVGVDDLQQGTPLPSAFMPPLYVLPVALAAWLARLAELGPVGLVWLVRVQNVGFAVLAMIALHRLVRIYAGARVATLACLLFAVYPTLIYQTTQVSALNLYLAVEIGLLAALAGLLHHATRGRILVAAVVTGGLCLLRSEAVALVPLIALWIGCAVRLGTRRQRLATVALFVVVAAVLPTAWMVRNAVVLEAPIITVTTTSGLNLWNGNHVDASGSQKQVVVPPELEAALNRVPPSSSYEVERDSILRRAALDYVIAHPLETALRDVKKVAMQLSVDVYDPRSTNPVYLGGYLVILVCGIAGWTSWSQSRSGHHDHRGLTTLMVGYVGFSLLIPMVFFALARYRVPVELVLLIGTAMLVGRFAGPARDAGDVDLERRHGHGEAVAR